MRPNILVRLLTSALLGALFGGYIAADRSQWFHLGRDAFLAYQARRFDIYMSRPNTGIGSVVVTAILAIGLAVIYEFVAIAGEKLLTRSSRRKENN